MKVLEAMERSGIKEETLAIAWIKDALHLVQSQYNDNVGTWTTTITKGTREYPYPANLIDLRSISVLDTNDDKYKKIRRMAHSPVVVKDNSPPT